MENQTDACCLQGLGPREDTDPPPALIAALDVLSGKWTILILWKLLGGTLRFSELRRAIPGITQHMLTQSLRTLEQHGVVTRHIHAQVPPRVDYALTDRGRALESAIRALTRWGHDNLEAKV
jgi:DNA-binding HxlR family transcriptional regulator